MCSYLYRVYVLKQMVIRIFMSGPIRPSEYSVRKAIYAIRSEFPDGILYLCVWKTTEDTTELREIVDHYVEVDEPIFEDVKRQITVSTLTDNRPDCAPVGWPIQCYKMMLGVNTLCDYAQAEDNDIIVRVRTDSVFRFRESVHRQIMNSVPHGYITWFAGMSGVNFTDWFAIATYENFKKGWRFANMEEYNVLLENRYNPEDVVKANLLRNGVHIIPLDMSKTECYLMRKNENGELVEKFC